MIGILAHSSLWNGEIHLKIDWWVSYDLNVFLDGVQVFEHVITVVVNLSTKLLANDGKPSRMTKTIVYEEIWRHIAIIYARVIEKGVFGYKISICVMKYEMATIENNERKGKWETPYPITLSSLDVHCVFFRLKIDTLPLPALHCYNV